MHTMWAVQCHSAFAAAVPAAGRRAASCAVPCSAQDTRSGVSRGTSMSRGAAVTPCSPVPASRHRLPVPWVCRAQPAPAAAEASSSGATEADASTQPTASSSGVSSGGNGNGSTSAAATQAATSSSTDSSAGSSSSSSSSSQVDDTPLTSPKKEAQLTLEQYKEIYDRLIKIFQQRPRDDWKKLIVFSKQWTQHRQGVYDRIKERSEAEADVDAKMGLRRLLRGLQGCDAEVERYNAVLASFLGAGEEEWEAVVAVYRGDLQKPFFEHMQCLIAAAKEDAERRETLVLVNTRLLALVTNYDSVAAEPEKLEAAAELYRDLLGSISSIEEADAKMEELSKAGKIDPAFLQITAKAYGAARDTNMTLDEAKWVSYRLYVRARDYFERKQPVEKRILEYLVNIRDPVERTKQLDAAVTPGPMRYTDTHDYMWSTPQRLFVVLDGTLKAFDSMQAAAAQRMAASERTTTPWKVKAMRELRDEIMRRYL